MVKISPQLEDLPNEVLIEIFQQLDAATLYKSFWNLNKRLNGILLSMKNLLLIVRAGEKHVSNRYDNQIETVIVYNNGVVNFCSLINLRRLVLIDSKDKQISQAMENARSVEHIGLISPRCFYTTLNFHEMIFSNEFPRLKSSCLTLVYLPSNEIAWKKSPSIRSLKISSRDPLIHLAILSSCPNLNEFDLTVRQLDHPSVSIDRHEHLRKLRIRFQDGQWPNDPSILVRFFELIPSLNDLCLDRVACLPEMIDDFLQFQWLTPVVFDHFQNLRRFSFFVQFLTADENRYLNLIETMNFNFRRFYSDSSRCSLRIIRL